MRTLFLSLLMLLWSTMAAAEGKPDLEKGEEINGVCAACHGRYGHGGKRGEYPRLGGQRAAHIEEQLRLFRDRKRINLPMFPYTQERELSEEDIRNVAAYLASIQLPTKVPEFKDSDGALARLEAMEKVMIVPKLEGDLGNGRKLYDQECADCHGKTGLGKGSSPLLVGQYTNYLMRQIEAYIRGERPHEDSEEPDILVRLSAKDIRDILAHITYLQDAQP